MEPTQQPLPPQPQPAQSTPPLPPTPTSAPTPAVAPVPSPTVLSQPVPPQPAPQQPGDHTAHLPRILLVEDDDSLSSVYLMRLQAEGFEVRRCSNGEEALADALNYKPDLILLDVMMPKVSGFDVLDILRNTPETAGVKVIMLTALGQDSDKQRAQALGVDDYLVKSQVVMADVIERIRFHLAN